jgi:hypothetical protein
MSAYIKKTERSQTNDLTLHLKLLEKQEQAIPKTSRRKEIIKITAEINETETAKTIQRFNETKRQFIEKINNIDRPLANLIKMRRVKTQINIIRNANREITISTKEIQEISETTLRAYMATNWKISKKWTEFYNLTTMQEDINHLNGSVTQKEIEVVIKSLPKKKSPGPDGFIAEFYETFKELTSTILKLFQEIERDILGGQYYSHSKSRQRHLQRVDLQDKFLDEYQCKNPH